MCKKDFPRDCPSCCFLFLSSRHKIALAVHWRYIVTSQVVTSKTHSPYFALFEHPNVVLNARMQPHDKIVNTVKPPDGTGRPGSVDDFICMTVKIQFFSTQPLTTVPWVSSTTFCHLLSLPTTGLIHAARLICPLEQTMSTLGLALEVCALPACWPLTLDWGLGPGTWEDPAQGTFRRVALTSFLHVSLLTNFSLFSEQTFGGLLSESCTNWDAGRDFQRPCYMENTTWLQLNYYNDSLPLNCACYNYVSS